MKLISPLFLLRFRCLVVSCCHPKGGDDSVSRDLPVTTFYKFTDMIGYNRLIFLSSHFLSRYTLIFWISSWFLTRRWAKRWGKVSSSSLTSSRTRDGGWGAIRSSEDSREEDDSWKRVFNHWRKRRGSGLNGARNGVTRRTSEKTKIDGRRSITLMNSIIYVH